jgi:hypothetical protein
MLRITSRLVAGTGPPRERTRRIALLVALAVVLLALVPLAGADSGTGSWAPTASLPGLPYYQQATAPLAPGKALLTAGYNNCCYGAVDWVRIYSDSGGGSFTDAAPFWKTLNGVAAAPLGQGKVLATGGQETHCCGGPDYAQAYIYDASSNSWSQTGSMAAPRFSAVAAPIDTSGTGIFGNGDALVVGGVSNETSGALATVELYHNGSFTTKAPLPIGLLQPAAASLGNGRVLVAGGSTAVDGSATQTGAYVYDPVTNSWSVAASMSTPRVGAIAFPLGAGKVLVAGGTCFCGGDYNTALSSTEVYDAGSNTWTPGSSLGEARRNFAGAALADGHLLAAGGLVNGGIDTTSSVLYTPPQLSYVFSGFLQPINDTAHNTSLLESKFKLGSTVPAKFQLRDGSGAIQQQATAPTFTRSANLGPCDSATSVEPVDADPGTAGQTYRFDASAQQYVYNWSTKGLAKGEYRIFANLDDGTKPSVDVCLQ